MASIITPIAPQLQIPREVRAEMDLRTQTDGTAVTYARTGAEQAAGLVGGAAQQILGPLGHAGLPLLTPASAGSNPLENRARHHTQAFLYESGTKRVETVKARVSFLGRLILGKGRDAEYVDRDLSSGFKVAGGRWLSKTMAVGVPKERAVALAGGWENLDLSEKKKDLESLLRKQINSGDFTSHRAEKTTLLQRALSRLLSSSSIEKKLRILALFLGKNPKEIFKEKFKSLTEDEKTKIIENIQKRLGKKETKKLVQERIQQLESDVRKLEQEISDADNSDAEPYFAEGLRQQLGQLEKELATLRKGKPSIAAYLTKLEAKDFLSENALVEKVFSDFYTVENFEKLHASAFKSSSKAALFPGRIKAEILLKDLSDEIAIHDLSETQIGSLTEKEKATLEQTYFVNTCFEVLRAVNSNRSWLKLSVYGGVITAGATLILKALSLKTALIAAGTLAGISAIALLAAAPYIVPVVIVLGLTLIVTGILLQRRDARELTLKQDRAAIDALLNMNEECAKEIERLGESDKAPELEKLRITSKEAISHMKEILEGLKLEHKKQGTGKILRIKRFFLGDHLALRIKQMSLMLDPDVVRLRREHRLIVRTTRLLKETINKMEKEIKSLDKGKRKERLDELSALKKQLKDLSSAAKITKFYISTKKGTVLDGTKEISFKEHFNKAEALVKLIQTMRGTLTQFSDKLLSDFPELHDAGDDTISLDDRREKDKIRATREALEVQKEALKEIDKAIDSVTEELKSEAQDRLSRLKTRLALDLPKAAAPEEKPPGSPASERTSSFDSVPSTADIGPGSSFDSGDEEAPLSPGFVPLGSPS